MGLLGNLPDIGKLSEMFDEDFAGLTQRLDQLIVLEQQILAALQAQQPKEAGQ